MKFLTLLIFCFFGLKSSAQIIQSVRPTSLPLESQAFQYFQQKDFENAAQLFSRLQMNQPSDIYFEYYIRSILSLKKFDEAEKLISSKIAESPKNLLYKACLLFLYQQSDKKNIADRTLNAILKELPKDELSIREFSSSLNRLELFNYSLSVLREGRKILNNAQLFNFELISLYRINKQKDLLVQEYMQVLEYMPEIVAQAQNSISYIFDSPKDYIILQDILEKRISKKPQKDVFLELLAWTYLQNKSYDFALKLIIQLNDKNDGDGSLLYTIAQTFANQKAYPSALKAYQHLLNKGKDSPFYLRASLEKINVHHLELAIKPKDREKILDLIKQCSLLIREFGENYTTLSAAKKMAQLYTYSLNEPIKGIEILERSLKLARLPNSEVSNLKLELANTYNLNKEPWEAFLVYEQIARDFEGTLNAHEANYRSAKLSYFQGDFKFALAKVNHLKTSTSQLIANDALNLSLLISDNVRSKEDSLALKLYADAELLSQQNQVDSALKLLNEIGVKQPKNSLGDDILMLQAKIQISLTNYKEASILLEQLVEKHKDSFWVDDALFELGNLNENHLNDPKKAMCYYEKLILEKSDSLRTADARTRFRNLRGDQL